MNVKNVSIDARRVKALRCDVYSRVVGYYTPVGQWNEGKKQEFHDRQMVDLGSMDGSGKTVERADQA